jgi:hypothetical protein
MKLSIALLSLGLAACSTVSEVVPMGKDTYMVGSSARGGFTSDAEVKSLAIKRANEYCSGQGKVAQVTSSSSTGVQMWTPQNSEVQFACIAK